MTWSRPMLRLTGGLLLSILGERVGSHSYAPLVRQEKPVGRPRPRFQMQGRASRPPPLGVRVPRVPLDGGIVAVALAVRSGSAEWSGRTRPPVRSPHISHAQPNTTRGPIGTTVMRRKLITPGTT